MEDANAETLKLRRWKPMMRVKAKMIVTSSDSEEEDNKEIEENKNPKVKHTRST